MAPDRKALAALGIAAAGAVLVADLPAGAAALAFWGAVAAAWGLGRGRSFTAAFLVSLGAGTALAAGAAAPFFGLPLSLWGLFLGVFLIPLLLTTVGFAVGFEPPDADGLERLRKK